MTMMTTAEMAALAAFHLAHVPTRAAHKEVHGVNRATNTASKPGQRAMSTCTEESLQSKRGAHLTMVEWAVFNIAEEYQYTTAFERYIC
jgi:hypothetical protein